MNAFRSIQNLFPMLFRREGKTEREIEFLGYEAFSPVKSPAPAAPVKQSAAAPDRKAA